MFKVYTVEYFVAGEELSSSVNIHVQSMVDIPEGIDMVVTATARDGVHTESSPSIISVRLHNTLDEEIQLDLGECRIVVNNDLYNSCGPYNLAQNEVVTIDQFPVIPTYGDNDFTVSLGSQSLSQTVSFSAIPDVDDGESTGDLSTIDLDLILDGDSLFGELENFESDIYLFQKENLNIILHRSF